MHSNSGRSSTPKVSICIPAYNGQEHLKECINSIRSQTFKDLEVVVCDDESTDGTLDLARKLADGDERFRFISNRQRLGLVGNWNNCIAKSLGEWIKFVFQDDVIAPTCVEKLLQACEKTGQSFGFCARDFIIEDGTSEEYRSVYLVNKATLESWYMKKDTIQASDVGRYAFTEPRFNPFGEPTVTLIHRSVFKELGLFEETLIQSCDCEFWFRVISNQGAAWVPEPLATFRVHAKATTVCNVTTRSFRMSRIDPLVMRYRFAFAAIYAKLRSERLTGKSEFRLRKEVAEEAYHVKHDAWSGSRGIPGSARDLMKEWKSVSRAYPRLNWLANVGFVVALLRLAKKAAVVRTS